MKVHVLSCTADRFGVTLKRLRTIDLGKFSVNDAFEIAQDQLGPKPLWSKFNERQDVVAKQWFIRDVEKRIKKNGWCDFITDDHGWMFIRADAGVVFHAEKVAKMCQAWGRNLVGEG